MLACRPGSKVPGAVARTGVMHGNIDIVASERRRPDKQANAEAGVANCERAG